MVQLVNHDVGEIGFGLMGFTARPDPMPYEEAFKAMRKALALGANCWNGGELYGTPDRNSLHLLNAYFKAYPEDADKVNLCIKGGMVPGTFNADGSPENARRSIDECLKTLDGVKKLDMFEYGRVDKNVPYETTIGVIAEYVKAGKVGGVSLSEVSADTIHKIAKITKVCAVEVEFSLVCPDILENGIADACKELDIPIVAYSPLCRGFLTGGWQKPEDVPERMRRFPRFVGEAFYENRKLVGEVERIAKDKGVTVAQVAISWILAMSGKNGLPILIPIPGATTVPRVEENMTKIDLTEAEMASINDLLKGFKASGTRYPGTFNDMING